MLTINIVLKGKKTEATIPEAKVLWQELDIIFAPAKDHAIYPVYAGEPTLVRTDELDKAM